MLEFIGRLGGKNEILAEWCRTSGAWGFYGHRLALYRATQPNPGFQILKRWGEAKPRGYAVFTSNVDGHFQKAGFEQNTIEECHGSIHHLQCIKPCCKAIWSADDFAPDVDTAQCLLLNAMPVCPHCGEIARPNILMFGDWQWLRHRKASQANRMDHWLNIVSKPVVVEIGAGTAIPSVRHFSQRVMQEFDGRLVRINPREFSVPTTMGAGISAGAVQALVEIDRLMRAL